MVLAPTAIRDRLACLTFSVLDNFGLAGLHDCDAGVCGAKINADNAKKLSDAQVGLTW